MLKLYYVVFLCVISFYQNLLMEFWWLVLGTAESESTMLVLVKQRMCVVATQVELSALQLLQMFPTCSGVPLRMER
jgi:hypothetical protein